MALYVDGNLGGSPSEGRLLNECRPHYRRKVEEGKQAADSPGICRATRLGLQDNLEQDALFLSQS